MDIVAFEFFIEDLAAALHADLLLLQVGNAPLPALTTSPRYLAPAIGILTSYRTTPLSLDEEGVLEEALRDAERRIWFGIASARGCPIRCHLFLRDQLTYAFSSTEERKGLFGGGFEQRLETILEE
jgi:hypothetical protein